MNKDELYEDINAGNIYLIDSTATSSSPSGKVILMMCKLAEKRTGVSKEWGNDDFVLMKKFKVSTNSGSHIHHGSGGHHYSFGNKNFNGKVANFSVSQYVLKKRAK